MVIDFWLADENIVFAAALVLMVALGVLQLIGFGGFDSDVDMDADVDGTGVAGGLLSFFGWGRLPFLILLVLFLLVFGLTGFAGQQFIQTLTGRLLPPSLAAAGALLVALPLTGLLSKPLARIIPQDETTAVSIDELTGRRAIIDIGTAKPGYPARAKVKDRYGHGHALMVEPDSEDGIFLAGEEVLLVRRDGDIFKAVAVGTHWLSET
ncbi:OB-fold-containig protein [Sphingorhabdus sp. SMR4y]|uniref:OB-fold-containig protein n=1 Tax=Sphingorhabdus sp. SMR4y TaxID=2584094 RepID=UPI000B5CE15E|nr:OB-fold-containig protein [Sphingorhabdus sp. SMR4y]ASK87258.1 inner membrane protein YqiJ [Sphingorhabdus sp. SMR4y]